MFDLMSFDKIDERPEGEEDYDLTAQVCVM